MSDPFPRVVPTLGGLRSLDLIICSTGQPENGSPQEEARNPPAHKLSRPAGSGAAPDSFRELWILLFLDTHDESQRITEARSSLRGAFDRSILSQ